VPVLADKTDGGRAKNRRVELVKQLPCFNSGSEFNRNII